MAAPIRYLGVVLEPREPATERQVATFYARPFTTPLPVYPVAADFTAFLSRVSTATP